MIPALETEPRTIESVRAVAATHPCRLHGHSRLEIAIFLKLKPLIADLVLGEYDAMGIFESSNRRRELDLYSESLRCAIEVQGPSHIPGGLWNTEAILAKDEAKRVRCEELGIRLLPLYWAPGAEEQKELLSQAAAHFGVEVDGTATAGAIKTFAKTKCSTGECYEAALMDELLDFAAIEMRRPGKHCEPELRSAFENLTDSRGPHYVTDFREMYKKLCTSLTLSRGLIVSINGN